MNRKEIVNCVEKYIRSENARYAVLINGAWGSGKTYMYENYIVPAVDDIEIGKDQRKVNVYISLYGIATIEALSKQILSNYIINGKCNDNKILKTGIKATSGILNIISNAVTLSLGAASVDFSKALNEIDNLVSIKNLVICFDDLERCMIPISEFFGYVNNLVEHCNCKVIVLADENNICKTFANTSVEEKYKTILMGGRKVVENSEDNGRTKQFNRSESNKNEITVSELKRLNEQLYSENYIYKDIKEKVIGRTFDYTPRMSETINEIISNKERGMVLAEDYRSYLQENVKSISSYFEECKNKNLRTVLIWIENFSKIYTTTTKNFNKNEFLLEVLDNFMRYSIWCVSSYFLNKRLIYSSNYGRGEFVHFEGNEYTHIEKYYFIDSFIRRDIWEESALIKSSRMIIDRKEKEKLNAPKRKKSLGVSYSKLGEWRYMKDEEIHREIENMLVELKENLYAYYDYGNILRLLLFFEEIGLYSGDMEIIKETMIQLIDDDTEIQDEPRIPKSFNNEDEKTTYKKYYDLISEKRIKKNKELSLEEVAEEKIYDTAQGFLDNCKKREGFYFNHSTFMEYIDINRLLDLIGKSDIEGIYKIVDAFECIYHMSNVRDFYMSDVEKLIQLRKRLITQLNVIGITRKMAVDSLVKEIENVIKGLDQDIDVNEQ